MYELIKEVLEATDEQMAMLDEETVVLVWEADENGK